MTITATLESREINLDGRNRIEEWLFTVEDHDGKTFEVEIGEYLEEPTILFWIEGKELDDEPWAVTDHGSAKVNARGTVINYLQVPECVQICLELIGFKIDRYLEGK